MRRLLDVRSYQVFLIQIIREGRVFAFFYVRRHFHINLSHAICPWPPTYHRGNMFIKYEHGTVTNKNVPRDFAGIWTRLARSDIFWRPKGTFCGTELNCWEMAFCNQIKCTCKQDRLSGINMVTCEEDINLPYLHVFTNHISIMNGWGFSYLVYAGGQAFFTNMCAVLFGWC